MFDEFVVIRTKASPDLIQWQLTDANLHSVKMTPRADGTVRFDAPRGSGLRLALEANIASRMRRDYGWTEVG